MYLETDISGKIIKAENVQIGSLIDMRSNKHLHNCIDIEEVKEGVYMFDTPYFAIEDDIFKFLALPGNYRGNIYLFEAENMICFSDDFFTLCKRVGAIHFNYEDLDCFMKTTSLPVGKTWAKEIKCLVGHKVYYIEKGIKSCSIKFINETPSINEEDLYEEFKKKLDLTVDTYGAGKNALLLSGGADSRLLALVMKKNGCDFETYTAVNRPYFYSGLDDVEGAINISEIIGINNHLVEVDFNKVDIKDLDKVIEAMPLAAHMSVTHLGLMKKIAEDGKEKVWAGQNADNLYNLGPSGRFELNFSGLMNLYKRFCISEEFFLGFEDVEGYSKFRKNINSIIANPGCKIYNRMKNMNVMLPETIDDLISNYKNSYDYTIFQTDKEGATEKIIGEKNYTPYMVKKEIFNHKTENYLKSGASVVVDSTSELCGIKDYVLPFSSEYMLPVFNNIHLTCKDIFRPKKFIYNYISEFEEQYGKKITKYNSISKKMYEEKYKGVRDIHTVYEEVMLNTEFGQALALGEATVKPQGYTGVQYLQTSICKYWQNKVIDLLENKYEVLILNRRNV